MSTAKGFEKRQEVPCFTFTENSKRFAIFGSAATPAELMFIIKNYPDVMWYHLSYINCGFFNDQDKKRLKQLEKSFPCSVTIAAPEDLTEGSFDFSVCLGCNFRSVSPKVYNEGNEQLKKQGINCSFPLFSDENELLPFVLGAMNLLRFLVSLVKVGGLVVCYPTSVSFQVLAAFDAYGDYRILDFEEEVTWSRTIPM